MTAVYEMAKKYYPTLWNEQRIRALYEAGKLTQEEYEGVIGDVEAELRELIDTVGRDGMTDSQIKAAEALELL